MTSEGAHPLQGYPLWLINAKRCIKDSKDWANFVSELLPTADRLSSEHFSSSFLALSDVQKMQTVNEAVRILGKSRTFKSASSEISQVMDGCLRGKIANYTLAGGTVARETRTDALLELVLDGAVSILQRRPDLKSKLPTSFLNRLLPTTLRSITYALFLANGTVSQASVGAVLSLSTNEPSHDQESISQTCQDILNSQTTFHNLKNSEGAMHIMKTTLHCINALQPATAATDSPLQTEEALRADYLLILPLLDAAFLGSTIDREAAGKSEIITSLVAQYSTFMAQRPGYTRAVTEDSEDHETKDFCAKLAQHLMKLDRGLSAVLGSMSISQNTGGETAEFSIRVQLDDAVLVSPLITTLTAMVRPWLRVFFVGYMNLRMLMFVWDQYIMSIGQPTYHSLILSAITTVVILTIHSQLLACKSLSDVLTVCSNGLATIDVKAVRSLIRQHFYDELRAALSPPGAGEQASGHAENEDRSALFPRATKTLPWSYWKTNAAQEEELMTHKAAASLQQQQQADIQAVTRQQRGYAASYSMPRGNPRSGRLTALLAEEVRRRELSERRHDDEMANLRHQLAELRSLHPAIFDPTSILWGRQDVSQLIQPYSDMSLRSIPRYSRTLPAPSPSKVDRFVSPAAAAATVYQVPTLPVHEPTLSTTQVAVRDVAVDILRRLAGAFDYIAHDEAERRDSLNAATAISIRNNREDTQKAELAIFGRHLEPGELEQLPLNERNEKKERMAEVVRQLATSRKQQLNAANSVVM